MAMRCFLAHALRLAGIAVAATLLTASSTLLTALPLQASTSVPARSSAAAVSGIIAYVRRSTHDIHVVAPDGTGDRVLWSNPRPDGPNGVLDLAWRPDGRELAFSSDHEETCSWYQSDVYAIGYTGAGYRRITNAPACAVLATLPKGSVTVNVSNYTDSWIQYYVAGAPGIKSFHDSGTLTFDNVADLGSGVPQPAVGIYGLYRVPAYPPYPDVQPNTTTAGGNVVIMDYSSLYGWGTGNVSWKADGSTLAYTMRTSTIHQIPAIPPYGSIGQMLPVVENALPGLATWGPTAATRDQYLYFSANDVIHEDVFGIYLNTAGSTSGGTQIISFRGSDAVGVHDIEWLPDGSGFLFSLWYVPLDITHDIFEYDFATQQITQLTHLPGNQGAYGLSISPDGQYVAFEWVADELNSASSVWIMNRDGSGLHKLADDAAHPAWGRVPAPLSPRAYVPALAR